MQGKFRKRWLVVAVVAVLLVPVGWSYGNALTAPGTDGLGVRSVEWLRGHGGSRLVASTERWWYAHHQPRKGGPPPKALTSAGGLGTPAPVTDGSAANTAGTAAPAGAAGSSAPASVLGELPAPARLASLAGAALPAEGVWRPTGRLVDGHPAVFTTLIRPDAVHTGLATGVAWIDAKLVRAVLFAGVQVPGGTWANEAPISAAERPSLVAAFNSGFRLPESRGGYFTEGRTARPLVDGAASFVIDTSGTATVGQWGRDVTMKPTVASVRQNLSLIVDQGAPVPGLDENVHGRWGVTLGNKLFVWRSGVGVTADGALVYAAGNGLSVATLAAVLADAGCVRAMELDINSEWTRFFTYDGAVPGQPSALVGTKLVPDMRSLPNMYLEAETRDFIALLAR